MFPLSASDQHLILGAEEGIYTLNLNGSEATMELVGPLFHSYRATSVLAKFGSETGGVVLASLLFLRLLWCESQSKMLKMSLTLEERMIRKA